MPTRLILPSVCALHLLACATPYQAGGLAGGYRDEKIGEGRYFVSFEGNAYTSASTVTGYLHRRAAELCTSAGYDGYEIVAADGNTDRALWMQRGKASTTVTEIEAHERSAIVQCTRAVPVTAQAAPMYPNAPGPPPASSSWYCSELLGETFAASGCYRTVEECENWRKTAIETNGPHTIMSPCRSVVVAHCFDFMSDGTAVESCYMHERDCMSTSETAVKEGYVTGRCTIRN